LGTDVQIMIQILKYKKREIEWMSL
jgi:hypothetical protein